MSRQRWVALAGLSAALTLYTAGSDRLWEAGLWPDVLFLSLVVLPATFLIAWIVLPAAFGRAVLAAGLTLVVLAGILYLADLDVLFNLAKLLALIALGFWFLSYFETVAWAVLIAAIIPWVDIWSVFFGPTEKVTEDHPSVFNDIAIEFAVPGQEEGARIGPPDILFFSLFLGAAARFGLRVAWTWIGMTSMLSLTLIVVATTDIDGLPALPAVCIGFLLPNADRLWHALRRRGRAPVRIYGRTDTSFYDLDADVIERGPAAVVVLTRDRPPVMATIEPVRDGDSFPAVPTEGPASELPCRLKIGGTDAGEALVHDLPKGMVIVPRDENPTVLYNVHPEQLAADEAKVERLRRERS